MRHTIRLLPLLAAAVLAMPAAAFAAVTHTVHRGETLTSIAAADGLSVARLAAANGLSDGAELVAGTQLVIPPQGGPVASSGSVISEDVSGPVQSASAASSGGYAVRAGDTLSAIAAHFGTSAAALAAANGMSVNGILLAGSTLTIPGGGSASSQDVSAPLSSAGASSAGGYVVHRGDTLSGIAARFGTSAAALAAANGMSASGVLLAGRTLTVPGASETSSPPAASSAVASGSGAEPVAQYVTPGEVGSIAADDGVPAALAEAIADQESGFNDAMVSSSGATGVMQLEPSTWNDLSRIDGLRLSPSSALDNVRGGVAVLRSLLLATGGDQNEAIAAYYQGLDSVRRQGVLPGTRRYVANVLALEGRFGG